LYLTGTHMAKKKILIVEDEYIIAFDLKTQLMMKANSNFDIVATGEEAVKRALIEKFDLIFMDIILQGELDGIDAANIIKQKQDVSIIFISGNSDLLKSKRLKKTEPSGILHKPITEYALMEVLKKVLIE